MNDIIKYEEDEYTYEFDVAIELKNGDFLLHSSYAYADEAYKIAEEIGGIVIHNVRVSHKELNRYSILRKDKNL